MVRRGVGKILGFGPRERSAILTDLERGREERGRAKTCTHGEQRVRANNKKGSERERTTVPTLERAKEREEGEEVVGGERQRRGATGMQTQAVNIN